MSTVTLQDVAKKSGVSIKTVSRVLNNEPTVAEKTLEKVKVAIAQLNYVPNAAARKLSSGKAMAIGLAMGWPVNGPFSSTLVDSTLKETKENGYGLSLFSVDHGLTDDLVEAFRGKQVDGFILDTPAGKHEGLTSQLNSLDIPYIVIHPSTRHGHPRASYIRINDQMGARQAVDYLIQLGHRAIGYLTFQSGIRQEQARLKGYQKSLAEAAIPFRKEWIFGLPSTELFKIGFIGAQYLLSNSKELTAIFASTDDIAMGALGAIWQMGLKIPEDISVVGFDDVPYAAMTAPPLTTIHQPIEQIAQLSVKHLIQMINNPEQAPVDIVLPTELIIRDSCKAPRQRK